MKEQQVEINLSEEDQMIEMGRLAGECLENEAFQTIMHGAGEDLQKKFNELKPQDQFDFTVAAAQREIFNQIIGEFNAYKNHAEELKKGLKREAGLV